MSKVRNILKTTAACACLALWQAPAARGAAGPIGDATVRSAPLLADADAPDPNAKPKKKAAKGKSTVTPKGMKAKHLSGEATLKTKDQKNVDFDAADIGGERKTPMGTLINQNKADKNYDFVKIRLRWHPEMVQSASELDTGGPSK